MHKFLTKMYLRVLVAVLPTAMPAIASAAELPSGEAMTRWGGEPVVFVGRLVRVRSVTTGRSDSPVHRSTLFLRVTEVLRGPVTKGAILTCQHVARGEEPQFPRGQDCMVSAVGTGGQIGVQSIGRATPEVVLEARQVCALPIGWSIRDGKLLSPWSALGAGAWPTSPKDATGPACSVTGRPAAMLGKGVTLSVAPVPPARKQRWINPDGDGEFELTVTNTTDRPVDLPALRTDGKRILWEECVLLHSQGTIRLAPGAKGVSGETKPVRLEPGKSVTGRLNLLATPGVDWPRIADRTEWTFCLGEASATVPFYYCPRHHGPLRAAAARQPTMAPTHTQPARE